MNMTHNIIPVTPLTKETLKNFKDDKSVQERIIIMKGYVQKIYGEVIKTAVNGNTSYTVSLSSLFNYQLYLHDKQHIIELITELYLVFPDSSIQYTEKNLYDIQDNKTFVKCIDIDWV
jgi:hypothetical protein